MWNMYLDKILTVDHLKSRGWKMANQCVMSLVKEESVNHLFVHCLMVRTFVIFSSPSSVFLGLFHSALKSCWISGLDRVAFGVWLYLLGALFWAVWKGSNGRVFVLLRISRRGWKVWLPCCTLTFLIGCLLWKILKSWIVIIIIFLFFFFWGGGGRRTLVFCLFYLFAVLFSLF